MIAPLNRSTIFSCNSRHSDVGSLACVCLYVVVVIIAGGAVAANDAVESRVEVVATRRETTIRKKEEEGVGQSLLDV